MKRALTLVEVLLVVVILGLLAMVVIPRFVGVDGVRGNEENVKRVEAEVICFGDAWLGGCGMRESLLLVRLPEGELVLWHPINPHTVGVEPNQRTVKVKYVEEGERKFFPLPHTD